MNVNSHRRIVRNAGKPMPPDAPRVLDLLPQPPGQPGVNLVERTEALLGRLDPPMTLLSQPLAALRKSASNR